MLLDAVAMYLENEGGFVWWLEVIVLVVFTCISCATKLAAQCHRMVPATICQGKTAPAQQQYHGYHQRQQPQADLHRDGGDFSGPTHTLCVSCCSCSLILLVLLDCTHTP